VKKMRKGSGESMYTPQGRGFTPTFWGDGWGSKEEAQGHGKMEKGDSSGGKMKGKLMGRKMGGSCPGCSG